MNEPLAHDRDRDDARFRALIEGAPDGVVISREGVVLYANQAALTLLGHTSAEAFVGQSMATFLEPAHLDTMRRRLMRMRETGERFPPYEYPAKRTDGSAITVEISSIFIEYEGAPAVLAFARDVTERTRLRAQLAHSDRLAALGRLAAGVAHEINNPLALVSMSVDRLRARLGVATAEELARLTEDVREGVGRIATIARDLRLYARFDTEPTGAVDLVEAIDAATRLTAHEVRPRAELRREFDELPPVVGEARGLEQVLVNLLLNAAFAIEEGTRGGVVTIRAKADDAQVTLEVHDNGVGIPHEHRERIFEPFSTTRAAGAGTGLGLAIARDLVRRFGGSLDVESGVDTGTTMRLQLRVAERESIASEPSTKPESRKRPPRRRILVIDDEPLLVSMFVLAFRDRHDIVGETNPHAGLERLRTDPSFDVVFCDVMMPGLDGMALFERIKQERPGYERRFVFVTGGAYTPAAERFLDRVENPKLLKPFSLDDLARHVEGAPSAPIDLKT